MNQLRVPLIPSWSRECEFLESESYPELSGVGRVSAMVAQTYGTGSNTVLRL
jgi:hypothetical protein